MNFGNINIEEPNICPHCHVVNEPEFKHMEHTHSLEENRQIITLWRCTHSKCNRHFPILYERFEGYKYEFIRFLDGLPKGPEWPEPILNLKSGNNEDIEKDLQSRFIETYLQSLTAENEGLYEIAGMGFRKSVEYLVKDWAIQSNPKDAEIINKLWLGEVIKKYYEGDLKGILERASWLGNDQAHYNKLFEEYDIKVLKELINLIMVELDRQFKLKHYNETIQKRK
ncbi:hypothetical protein [Polaribacter staleyi]|uniref:hypothetical protein n=1 Tax=Polaribacter staleyi TaxID=2022337 RepID=UPI0031BA3E6C